MDFEQRKTFARIPADTTFINGEFVPGEGERFESRFPATGQLVAEMSATSESQVDAAIEAAHAAFPAWRRTGALERARILESAATRIMSDMERLATLIVLDNGKTLREARLDVIACAELLRSAAGWATRLKGTSLPDDGSTLRLTWREPLGVIATIMPFNAPLMFCGMKISVALATGNTVVAKAPEKSPLAPVLYAEHLKAAGLPDGVLNIVQGYGDVGQRMVESETVRMVSFTGSDTVGAKVGAAAASRLKRLILELGGKSANIVYDDAPFDAAVEASLGAIFRNAGQRCWSGSRILVQEGIAESFIERYVERARALRVGDPFDESSQVGSLITRADVERVAGLVAAAEEAGARILAGGRQPEGASADSGYFLPTVIDATDVPDLPLLDQEVFGPVVLIQRFSTDEEAIQIANSSKYGLAGGCWTQDVGRGLETARQIDSGIFFLNCYGATTGPEATLESRKNSGFGPEKGEDGAIEYTSAKTVLIDTAHGASVTPIGS